MPCCSNSKCNKNKCLNNALSKCHKSRPLSKCDVSKRRTYGEPEEKNDIIIVGAGTSGSLLAYRLTEAFPNQKILVLEPGKDDVRDNLTRVPGTENSVELIGTNPNQLTPFPDDWAQNGRGVNTLFMTDCFAKQQQIVSLNDQADAKTPIAYGRGATLGGTSVINGNRYNRGTNSATYNRWESVLNDPEWGAQAMNDAYVSIENRSQINKSVAGNFVQPYWTDTLPPTGERTLNLAYHGIGGRINLTTSLRGGVPGAPPTADIYSGYGVQALTEVLTTAPELSSRFAGNIDLDPDDPANDGKEFTFNGPITQYDQSNKDTYEAINPYPLDTPGTTYIPPGDPANAKGPEYAGSALRLTNPATIPPNGSSGGAKSLQQRCSAAPAFLYPILGVDPNGSLPPNNTTILEKTYVTKLLFADEVGGTDPTEVVGVEYYTNAWNLELIDRSALVEGINNRPTCRKEQAKLNQSNSFVEKKRAFAALDVWLCAGAIDSPAILQRSGVGRRSHLENLVEPVNVRIDLPGVGYAVQDTLDKAFNILHEINLNTGLPAPAPVSIGESFYGFTLPADGGPTTFSVAGLTLPSIYQTRIKSNPTKSNTDAVLLYSSYIPGLEGSMWTSPFNMTNPLGLFSFQATGLFDLKEPNYPVWDTVGAGFVEADFSKRIPITHTAQFAIELFDVKSEGTCLINSANPFIPPLYAPGMLTNEDDFQAVVDIFQNTILPAAKGMSQYRLGPNGSLPVPLPPPAVPQLQVDKAIVEASNPNNRNFVRFLSPSGDELFSDSALLSGSSLSGTTGSRVIEVTTAVAHGLDVSDIIKISDADVTGTGLVASNINEYHVVMSVPDTTSFTIVLFYNQTKIPAYGNIPMPDPSPTADFSGKSCTVHKLTFDKQKLRTHLKQINFSGWHGCRSCRMGTEDDLQAVVDTRCRVYGAKGVRVVDCSIFPTKPDANTMAPAYGVAQRIYELVKPEYEALLL